MCTATVAAALGNHNHGGPGSYPSRNHHHHHHLPSLSAVHALQPPHYPYSSSLDALPGPYSVLNADTCSSSHTSKRKRSWSRAVFSNLQRKGLEKRFDVQKYVTKPDRRQLANMLGLTDAQVKVWFQNRRMKWRHAQQQVERQKQDGSTPTTTKQDTDTDNATQTDGAEKGKDIGDASDDEDASINIDTSIEDDDLLSHDEESNNSIGNGNDSIRCRKDDDSLHEDTTIINVMIPSPMSKEGGDERSVDTETRNNGMITNSSSFDSVDVVNNNSGRGPSSPLHTSPHKLVPSMLHQDTISMK